MTNRSQSKQRGGMLVGSNPAMLPPPQISTNEEISTIYEISNTTRISNTSDFEIYKVSNNKLTRLQRGFAA